MNREFGVTENTFKRNDQYFAISNLHTSLIQGNVKDDHLEF